MARLISVNFIIVLYFLLLNGTVHSEIRDLLGSIRTCETISVQFLYKNDTSLFDVVVSNSTSEEEALFDRESSEENVMAVGWSGVNVSVVNSDYELVNVSVSGRRKSRCRTYRPCYKTCMDAVTETCATRTCFKYMKKEFYKRCKYHCKNNFD